MISHAVMTVLPMGSAASVHKAAIAMSAIFGLVCATACSASSAGTAYRAQQCRPTRSPAHACQGKHAAMHRDGLQPSSE